MRLVLLLTSVYGDPCAEDWQPELRHAATFLRRAGVDVDVVYRATLDGAGLPGEERSVLYVELTEENAAGALAALEHIGDRTVAVGGPAPSADPVGVLAAHGAVDYVVVGERELPLLGLLRRLAGGRRPDDVAGVTGRGFATPPGRPIADLDVLGPLATDGLARSLDGRPAAARVGYVSASRGCYARCAFCGVPAFSRSGGGPAWRARSPRFVVDEMTRLAGELHLGRFVFTDDNFIGPGRGGHERAVEIARLLLARRLDVRFSLCCRVTDVRRSTLEPLVEAGLDRLGMSIESLHEDSLRLLQKGCTVAGAEAALDVVESLPLTCEINLIFFDPYLTLAGVRRNLDLIERIRASEHLVYSDAFPFNELRAFPWAPVTRRLRDDGLLAASSSEPGYRDAAVGELARFVRRLRDRLPPLAFKQRLLFDSLRRAGAAADPEAWADVLRVSDGLRAWVGLVVTPRYVRAACDELEAAGAPSPATGEALARLEEAYADEVAVLSTVERAMGMTLGVTGARDPTPVSADDLGDAVLI